MGLIPSLLFGAAAAAGAARASKKNGPDPSVPPPMQPSSPAPAGAISPTSPGGASPATLGGTSRAGAFGNFSPVGGGAGASPSTAFKTLLGQ